jgi:hypothetical protein
MKASKFSRYAGVTVAAALLAGCGGSHSMVPQTNVGMPSMGLQQQMPGLEQPANGGAFSGSYSGTYTTYTNPSGCKGITFKGKGRSSFLGSGRESGTFDVGHSVRGCVALGVSFTLKSLRFRKSTIHIGSNRLIGVGSGYLEYHYKVTGGTGRFAKAGGGGRIAITYGSGPSGTYSDTYTGTFSF